MGDEIAFFFSARILYADFGVRALTDFIIRPDLLKKLETSRSRSAMRAMPSAEMRLFFLRVFLLRCLSSRPIVWSQNDEVQRKALRLYRSCYPLVGRVCRGLAGAEIVTKPRLTASPQHG